jgi:DNA-binding CsgD family transcriptional regulator
MVRDAAGTVGSRRHGVPLTRPERELLAVLARGAHVGQVACELGLPEDQVRMVLASALGKLGVQSGPEAVVVAPRRGAADHAGIAGSRGGASDRHPSRGVRRRAGARHLDAAIVLEAGRTLPRIPYFPLPREPLEARCGSCGVVPGALHRRGCEREACPSCGDRLGRCGCTS